MNNDLLEQVWRQHQKNSITANKKLVERFGTDAAIIFGELLARYRYFAVKGQLKGGYFYNSRKNLQNGTGLGRRTQERIIPGLVEAGLLEMKHYNGQARRFKINLAAVNELLDQVQNVPGIEDDQVQNGPGPGPKRTRYQVQNGPQITISNNELKELGEGNPPAKDDDGKKQVQECLTLYKELFTRYTGQAPILNYGKYKKMLQGVLAAIDPGEASELLEYYFQAADQYTTERAYPLELFISQINALRVKKKGLAEHKPPYLLMICRDCGERYDHSKGKCACKILR